MLHWYIGTAKPNVMYALSLLCCRGVIRCRTLQRQQCLTIPVHSVSSIHRRQNRTDRRRYQMPGAETHTLIHTYTYTHIKIGPSQAIVSRVLWLGVACFRCALIVTLGLRASGVSRGCVFAVCSNAGSCSLLQLLLKAGQLAPMQRTN